MGTRELNASPDLFLSQRKGASIELGLPALGRDLPLSLKQWGGQAEAGLLLPRSVELRRVTQVMSWETVLIRQCFPMAQHTALTVGSTNADCPATPSQVTSVTA